MWYKYRNWKQGAMSCGIIYIIIIAILFLSFILQSNTLQTSIEETVRVNMRAYSSDIDNKIANVASDVILLEELIKNHDFFNIIGDTADFKTIDDENSLGDDLYSWLNINTEYDQIRILDNSGMELMRVNYNNGNPSIVEDADLQNKGDRYYFVNAINLFDDTIYLSKLDLNMENGEIEYVNGIPKAMLRIASPLYDRNNQQIGLLIVNYLADNLFHDEETSSGEYTAFEAINTDGYFLHSSDSSIEFGFMYPDKTDETFSKYHSYDIFNESDPSINQNVFEGDLYTSLLITNVKMSGTISEYIGREIPVYSDNGDIILFGEVVMNSTTEFRNLVNSYYIYLSVALIFTIITSRLLDEVVYSRKQQIQSLEYTSNYDLLTGIPNRSNVVQYIEALNSKQEIYTVLFLDLDGFKSVNDNFGHAIGDEVLKDSAQRISNIIRDTDMLARIGGDEFVLVLPRLNKQEIIERIIDQIKKSIKEPFIYEEVHCKIGVSIGVAIQDGSYTTEDILSQADERMYDDKKQSK